MEIDPPTIYAICLSGLLVLSFTATRVVPRFRAGLWMQITRGTVTILHQTTLDL